MSEDLDRKISTTYRTIGILLLLALTYLFGYTMARWEAAKNTPDPIPYIITCPRTGGKPLTPQTLTQPI